MHEKHRERIRERFMKSGLDSFAPHEVLELLLFYCNPRGDVNPLAHELINAFGSLHGVFEASAEQLLQIKGIGPHAAVFLSMIPMVAKRYQNSVIGERPAIKNRQEAEAYCRSLFTGITQEHFYLVGLDTGMRVIASTPIAKGSLNEVPAYPRAVVDAALKLNAHSVLLCHNHPGGSPEPSDSDLYITGRLSAALDTINVELMDHLIVTQTQVFSFNKEHLLVKAEPNHFQMVADASQKLIKNILRKEEPAK